MAERVLYSVSQALVERARLFANLCGHPTQVVFIDVSDGDLEDNFVCEGNVEGRDACAGFVSRNPRPGEGSEEECDVLLGESGSPAQSPEVWDGDVSCHVSKCKQTIKRARPLVEGRTCVMRRPADGHAAGGCGDFGDFAGKD